MFEIYCTTIGDKFMRHVLNLWHIQLRFSLAIDYLHRHAIDIDSVRLCRSRDALK